MTLLPFSLDPEMRDVRVGDADRNQAAAEIDIAYADGRLTLNEHNDRIADVFKARTYGDLAELTKDLRGVAKPAKSPQVLPAGSIATRIVAFMGDRKYTGRLSVPEDMLIKVILGDVKIDLTHTSLPAKVHHMRLKVVMGDVKIWVPAGVHVVDETECFVGDSKIRGLDASPPCPTLVLSGTIVMGDLKVTGPKFEDWRKKLARAFR